MVSDEISHSRLILSAFGFTRVEDVCGGDGPVDPGESKVDYPVLFRSEDVVGAVAFVRAAAVPLVS
ncbi:hypothetical protein YC2023_104756 [Brassica napus]